MSDTRASRSTGSDAPTAAHGVVDSRLAGVPTSHYVDGHWTAGSGPAAPVEDPGSGAIVAEVATAGGSDVHDAIDAAARAQPAWGASSAYERAAVLERIALGIRSQLDDLAVALTLESGKRLVEAKAEWIAAASLFEWYAEEGKRAYGRIVPAARPGRRILVLVQPVGVVATITAWNFPAYLPARKWSAALAAGCAVVGRPSTSTPLSALLLARLAEEAGMPAGVLNVVSGPAAEMADAFLDDERVRKISLTGSASAGRYLMDRSGRTFTKLSLELGGSAPVVILDDADIERAAELSVEAKFRNAGQVCISPSRFLVDRRIMDEVTEAIVGRVRGLTLGHGLEPRTDVGPVLDGSSLAKVDGFVRDAEGRGARVITGGSVVERPGYFYAPTVVDRVDASMRLACDEVFGPVIALTAFDGDAEAMAAANSTLSGLAAYVHTRDLSRAVLFAEGLESGIVGVNDMLPATAEAPFGGWKSSGNGSEGGIEGLREYLDTKYIAIGV